MCKNDEYCVNGNKWNWFWQNSKLFFFVKLQIILCINVVNSKKSNNDLKEIYFVVSLKDLNPNQIRGGLNQKYWDKCDHTENQNTSLSYI